MVSTTIQKNLKSLFDQHWSSFSGLTILEGAEDLARVQLEIENGPRYAIVELSNTNSSEFKVLEVHSIAR